MLAVGEGIQGAADWLPEERTKRGRHGCGCWLEVTATTCVDGFVLVSYRSAEVGASPLVVWHCPGCGKLLRLWWKVSSWVVWMTT